MALNKPKVFMHIDTNDLIESLLNGVVEIFFEKKDGTPRLMKCTLQKSYIGRNINEQEKQQRADEFGPGIQCIHVWDVDERDWRSFRLDRVFSAQLTAG